MVQAQRVVALVLMIANILVLDEFLRGEVGKGILPYNFDVRKLPIYIPAFYIWNPSTHGQS